MRDLLKCMGLFGLGSIYVEDDPVRAIRVRETTRYHGRLRRKGIKTPAGTPPIGAAAQAAWDRTKRTSGKIYPRSSITETARRATQIYYGQLTEANGLVRLGGLRSRPNGLFMQQRGQ